MRRRRRALALGMLAALAGATNPARAVGLGPLTLSGVIDGPREGFMLDLYNPYEETAEFELYAVAFDGEEPQPRVSILPAGAALAAERSRKVLVVVDGLEAGETYRFRVCAQRRMPAEGLRINARVCSKITAHRVG